MGRDLLEEQNIPVTLEEEAELRQAGDEQVKVEVGSETARAKAAEKAITESLVGPWTAVEELDAKLEIDPSLQTLRIRKENGANQVRLRGGLIIPGENVAEGAALFKLPSGFRPAGLVHFYLPTITEGNPSALRKLNIASTGVVTIDIELSEGESFSLDGFTFNLT